MSENSLPIGPEYREIPDCPGFMAGSDGSLWSNWTRGRWPRRTDSWFPAPVRREKKAGSPLSVLLRTTSGFRVTDFVHRVILTTFVGPCPDGMIACHDPDYNRTNNALNNLRWATPTANSADCKRHGRHPSGGNHTNSKLRDEDIPTIFDLRRAGITHGDIAERFGVARVAITRILLGHRYTNAEANRTNPVVRGNGHYARGTRQWKAKLTNKSVIEMRRLRAEGWLQKDLATRFGVTPGTVCNILNGKAWSHLADTSGSPQLKDATA